MLKETITNKPSVQKVFKHIFQAEKKMIASRGMDLHKGMEIFFLLIFVARNICCIT
jgi:hypothetical protein